MTIFLFAMNPALMESAVLTEIVVIIMPYATLAAVGWWGSISP